MAEPKYFVWGKRFHSQVKEDFIKYNKDGQLGFEKRIQLLNSKIGRLDILITELGDYVAIYEIKATNWDLIKQNNIIKNAWSHQHQLLKYVDTYIEKDVNVSLGIIYPCPPKTPGLRERVEEYLENCGTPAYWFTEVKGS